MARESIHKAWMHETDPAVMHPKLEKLNMKVAEFIRNNLPERDLTEVDRAIDIVESPWRNQDENRLRKWFGEAEGAKSSAHSS